MKLGIYGLVGAGRSSLQSLFGITQAWSPSCWKTARSASAAPAMRRRLDCSMRRKKAGRHGAVPKLPIFQNVSLPSLARTSRNGFLRMAEELALARKYAER